MTTNPTFSMTQGQWHLNTDSDQGQFLDNESDPGPSAYPDSARYYGPGWEDDQLINTFNEDFNSTPSWNCYLRTDSTLLDSTSDIDDFPFNSGKQDECLNHQ